MSLPTAEDKLREVHKVIGEIITELLVDGHTDEAIDECKKMQLIEEMIRVGRDD